MSDVGVMLTEEIEALEHCQLDQCTDKSFREMTRLKKKALKVTR